MTRCGCGSTTTRRTPAPVAVRALSLIEPFGIDAAEQPLPVGDVLGMIEVQRRTAIPLFLHEGFFSVADVVGLLESGGIGAVGVNGERPGTGALRTMTTRPPEASARSSTTNRSGSARRPRPTSPWPATTGWATIPSRPAT